MDAARKDELRLAAEVGDAEAQYKYGVELFYEGADETPGLLWLERAAAQKYPAAMLELVFIHLDEAGSGQHYAPRKGMEYLLAAVQAGYAPAMTRYARALEEGDGIEPNIPEALRWYTLAAEAGEGEAAYLAAEMLRCGREPFLTQQPERGMEFLRRAAQLGDAYAMLEYARCYEEGAGVGKDPGQARAWYLQAAEAGNSEACLHAGCMLLEGIGGAASPQQAVALLETAAADGHTEAAYYLAGCCMQGVGISPNPRRAQELMKLCAETQFFDAAEIQAQWQRGKRVPVTSLAERYGKTPLSTLLLRLAAVILISFLLFAAATAWNHAYVFDMLK